MGDFLAVSFAAYAVDATAVHKATAVDFGTVVVAVEEEPVAFLASASANWQTYWLACLAPYHYQHRSVKCLIHLTC